MHHADKFAKRILFLEGFPNLQDLDPLRIGQSVEEIINADLATDLDARALYLEAAVYCPSINDCVSEQLFEEIVAARSVTLTSWERNLSSSSSLASNSIRKNTSANWDREVRPRG